MQISSRFYERRKTVKSSFFFCWLRLLDSLEVKVPYFQKKNCENVFNHVFIT